MIRANNPVSNDIASARQQFTVDGVESGGYYRSVVRALREINASVCSVQIFDRGCAAKACHRAISVAQKEVRNAVRMSQYSVPVIHKLPDTRCRVS